MLDHITYYVVIKISNLTAIDWELGLDDGPDVGIFLFKPLMQAVLWPVADLSKSTLSYGKVSLGKTCPETMCSDTQPAINVGLLLAHQRNIILMVFR